MKIALKLLLNNVNKY